MSRSMCGMGLLSGVLLSACHSAFTPVGVSVTALHEDGSPAGLLIADMGGLPACWRQDRGGVYLLDDDGALLWSLESGLHGPHTAQLSPAGDALLVADTCNDRVQVYDLPARTLRWDSARDCPELSLSHPNFAAFSGEGLADTLLISTLTDDRVLEVAPQRCGDSTEGNEVIWQFGGDGSLRLPHAVIPVAETGRVLIVDSGSPLAEEGRVIEVERFGPRSGEIVWSYPDTDCTHCAGTSWLRSARLTCSDDDCTRGSVLITDRDETIRVSRDLDAWATGAASTRELHMKHGDGYAYSAEHLTTWDGDDNGGAGWLLISHHGIHADEGWVRVVAAQRPDSSSPVWELRSLP